MHKLLNFISFLALIDLKVWKTIKWSPIVSRDHLEGLGVNPQVQGDTNYKYVIK